MASNGAVRPGVDALPTVSAPGPATGVPDERGLLALLGRWRWRLAAALVVGAIAGYVYVSNLAPTYQANADLMVGELSTEEDALTSRVLTPTYVTLATSTRVLEQALEESGVDMTVQELARRVRVQGTRTTRIVNVRVRDGDPARAALLANAIAAALVEVTTPKAPPPAAPSIRREFVWASRTYHEGELDEFVRRMGSVELYRSWAVDHPQEAAILARRPTTGQARRAERAAIRERESELARAASIVDPAFVPGSPIRPDVPLGVQYGALAALFAVLGLALLRQQAASRVQVGTDLGQATGVPFLGLVEEPAGVTHLGPGARATSSYRRLVGALGVGGPPAAARSVAVVGADTDIAAVVGNLAGAVADHGASVALVAAGPDADIGPGRIHAPEPSVEQASALLEQLLGRADVVLVSAASLEESPAGLIWGPLVDEVVVVAQRNRTRTRTVVRTVDALRGVGADVTGTTLRP
jgi:capsular polysaccharide biosynthesis protein